MSLLRTGDGVELIQLIVFYSRVMTLGWYWWHFANRWCILISRQCVFSKPQWWFCSFWTRHQKRWTPLTPILSFFSCTDKSFHRFNFSSNFGSLEWQFCPPQHGVPWYGKLTSDNNFRWFSPVILAKFRILTLPYPASLRESRQRVQNCQWSANWCEKDTKRAPKTSCK